MRESPAIPVIQTLISRGALLCSFDPVARDEAIPVELVPVPAEADAKCDLAMVTLAHQAPPLEEALRREGVPFRPWPE